MFLQLLQEQCLYSQAIVIVLAVIAGAMFIQSTNAKEPTKVKIISDKEQFEGGKLKIQLTDLNKTALSKEKVKIVVKNKKPIPRVKLSLIWI